MPTSTLPQTSDGELPQGSFEITLLERPAGLGDFVANNFGVDANTKKLQTMDAIGEVRRQKVIPVDTTGAADFQMETKDTISPRERETFIVDADRDGNKEPYMVEKSGRTFDIGAEFKCKTSIFCCVNPLPYRVGPGGVTPITGLDLATLGALAVTGANAGDLFTAVAHGLVGGDRVTLSVLTGLTGLTTLTDYYIIRASADTFQVAATYADATASVPVPVTFSADGTGTVAIGVDFAAAIPRDVVAVAGSWTATGLPTGLTISATTGKITGKPTAGPYVTTIKTQGTRTRGTHVTTLTGSRIFNWVVS